MIKANRTSLLAMPVVRSAGTITSGSQSVESGSKMYVYSGLGTSTTAIIGPQSPIVGSFSEGEWDNGTPYKWNGHTVLDFMFVEVYDDVGGEWVYSHTRFYCYLQKDGGTDIDANADNIAFRMEFNDGTSASFAPEEPGDWSVTQLSGGISAIHCSDVIADSDIDDIVDDLSRTDVLRLRNGETFSLFLAEEADTFDSTVAVKTEVKNAIIHIRAKDGEDSQIEATVDEWVDGTVTYWGYEEGANGAIAGNYSGMDIDKMYFFANSSTGGNAVFQFSVKKGPEETVPEFQSVTVSVNGVSETYPIGSFYEADVQSDNVTYTVLANAFNGETPISDGEIITLDVGFEEYWANMAGSAGVRKGWVYMGGTQGWRPLHAEVSLIGEFFKFPSGNLGVRGFELQWWNDWSFPGLSSWDKGGITGSFQWHRAYSNGHMVNLAYTDGAEEYYGKANMWYTEVMFNFSLSNPNASSPVLAHRQIGAITGSIENPVSGPVSMTLLDSLPDNTDNHLTVTDPSHPIQTGYGGTGSDRWTVRNPCGSVYYGTCPQMVGVYPSSTRYGNRAGVGTEALTNYEVKFEGSQHNNWATFDLPNAPVGIAAGFCLMDAYPSTWFQGNTCIIGNAKGRNPISTDITYPFRMHNRVQTSTTPCHFWTDSSTGEVNIEPVGGFQNNYWRNFFWSANPINHAIEVIPVPELDANFVNIVEHSYRYISSGGNTGAYPLDGERWRCMNSRRTLFTHLPQGGNSRFVDTNERIGQDGPDGVSYMTVCHGGFPVNGTAGTPEYFVVIESYHSSQFNSGSFNLRLAAPHVKVYRRMGSGLSNWQKVAEKNHYLLNSSTQLLGTMFKRTPVVGEVAVLSKVDGLFGSLEEYNKPGPSNSYCAGRFTVRTLTENQTPAPGEFVLAGPFLDDAGFQTEKIIYGKFEDWFELEDYLPPYMEGEYPVPNGGHPQVLCTHTGEVAINGPAAQGNKLYMGRCGLDAFLLEPTYHGYFNKERVCPFELANWQVMPKEGQPNTWVFAISGLCEVEEVLYQDGTIAGQPNMVQDGSLRILSPDGGTWQASTIVIEVPGVE